MVVVPRRVSPAPLLSSAADSGSGSTGDRGSSRCSLSAVTTTEAPLAAKREKETCLSFSPHCFPLLLLPPPLPLSLNPPLLLGRLLSHDLYDSCHFVLFFNRVE